MTAHSEEDFDKIKKFLKDYLEEGRHVIKATQIVDRVNTALGLAVHAIVVDHALESLWREGQIDAIHTPKCDYRIGYVCKGAHVSSVSNRGQ